MIGIIFSSTLTAGALGIGDGYYYTFDDYQISVRNYDVLSPSSYDSDSIGGSVSKGALYDGSETSGVGERRKINPITGKAVMDLGFSAETAPEGTEIGLKNYDADVVLFRFTENKLYLCTRNGNIKIDSEAGFYGFRIWLDVDKNTYTVQANGKTIAKNLKFLTDVKAINYFSAQTPDNSMGAVNLEYMKIYTDYLVNEQFLSSRGNVPDDWTIVGDGVSMKNDKSYNFGDRYALSVDDKSIIKENGITKKIDDYEKGLSFEYDFYTNDKVLDFGGSLLNDSKNVIRLGVKKEKFGYQLDDEFVPLCDVKLNLWNHVTLKIENGKAEIWLNYKKKAKDIELGKQKADSVKLSVGKVATGNVYFDNIMLQQLSKEPDGYPSVPVKPEKDTDALIGIQSCSIWREGTHMGWDSMNAYKDRTPYLGYYDEGSPEVSDWEIKWLVEHGIDFQMYCWFRQGANEYPIEAPRNSYGLHSGYFGSKYSDMLKFAIMWENENGTRCSGIEDFEENILPYWMEYYFKDSRYLVVDNKPVLAIYGYDAMVNVFKSEENVKKVYEIIDNECKKEGFDGVYIIMQSRSKNPETLKKIRDTGVDAVFHYTTGTIDIDNQMSQFERQRDAGKFEDGNIDSIASPGMGYNPECWGGADNSGFMTPENQEKLLLKVKEFVKTQSGLGGKLVAIDNWNEISEGHMYMPVNMYGFGYLDAVRSAFSKESEHTDEVPSDEAKKRFSHLYVQDREYVKNPYTRNIEHSKRFEDTYTDVFVRDFENDDISNYPIEKQIEDFRIENGMLCGRATANDPGFYIKDVNISSECIKKIKIRMKTGSNVIKGQVFYITTDDTKWNEKKSAKFNLDATGEFTEIVIDTSAISGFSGTVSEIRIDPVEQADDFQIDYVKLNGIDINNGTAISINGKPKVSTIGVIYKNDVMYAPIKEFSSALGVKWSPSIDNDYLQIRDTETDKCMKFKIGEEALFENDEYYFPVKDVAEKLGYPCEWNSDKLKVNIITVDDSEYTDDPTPDPVGAANFNMSDNFCGMTSFYNIGDRKVSKGVLTLTATTNDPLMWWYPKIKAEDYKYCNVRIKNKTQGGKFQIFFTTDSSGPISEKNSCVVSISKGDKDYKTYSLNFSANPTWKGNIEGLRIDPVDAVGDIAIDYIVFSNQPIENENGATSAMLGKNVLKGGTMDTRELAYESKDAKIVFDGNNKYLGKYSLKVSSSDNGTVLFPADISSGKSYTFTAYVKSADVDSISVGYYGSGEKAVNRVTSKVDGKWAKVSAALPKAEDNQNGICISSKSGIYYLDNMFLYENINPLDKVYKERKTPKTGPIKILVLGNSITQHQPSESLGWKGNWGMAATSEDKDYFHILSRYVKEIYPDAKIEIAAGHPFEKNFYNLSNVSQLDYKALVDFDADVIISSIGANINNSANENDSAFVSDQKFNPLHYINIIDYFNVYGDMKVIPVATTLTGPENISVIKQAADSKGWNLISCTDLSDEKYTAVPYKDAAVFGENVAEGVLRHPGDLGMQEMADRIWTALKPILEDIERK